MPSVSTQYVTGSLVARIVFQPIEESSRLFWSQNLSSPSKSVVPLITSLDLLNLLINLHLHLTFLIPSLIPLIPPLLHFLLGSRWSSTSAPQTLQTYLLLIPLLGINGVTEAYVQAVADERQVRKMAGWMIVWSGTVVVSVLAFKHLLGWEEKGMIAANAINMICRIVFNLNFIRSHVNEKLESVDAKLADKVKERISIRHVFPKPQFVISAIVGFGIIRWVEGLWDWKTLVGLGKLGVVGAVVGLWCIGIA
jgi:oligosaccharide translocation protein RFT1